MPDSETPGEVTRLLDRWRTGDTEAFDRLLPRVYDELRMLAGRCMTRERPGHTLQATALVHEAYFRLTGKRRAQVMDRAHFFAVAAQAMRRVLLDHARRQQAGKRNGTVETITLDHLPEPAPRPVLDVVMLDRALSALAEIDDRQARVVELRYLAGLTIDETAEVLDVSPSTVERLWRVARLWLKDHMQACATSS